MIDEARVRELVEETLDSDLTPEEVCREAPELLSAVRERWLAVRDVSAELDVLFPAREHESGAFDGPSTHDSSLPRITGYEVECVLGRGGVGIVYRAYHAKLDRTVALKMLLSGAYASAQELARFVREARAAAALQSANIVQVYDVGEVDGRPYFTMELVEGGSLAQKWKGAPQPADIAAELLSTLARAIDVAHRAGVVHRDLKPANILIAADGTPKISDFGLARRVDGGPSLTLSGTPIGTPSYMAPEQALGKAGAIGPRVDVYALGAILYEMLTGRPPFRADTTIETERQLLTEEPVPPSRLNGSVPRDLETIALKCLHKEPDRRYASAGAFADDLDRFRRGEPIEARRASVIERSVKWIRRHPMRAASISAGALASVALLAGASWMRAQREALARAVRGDLAEVALRTRSAEWNEARTALERARGRAGDGAASDERFAVERASRALDLAAELESIRVNRAAVVEGLFDERANEERAALDYEAAFRAGGFGGTGEDAAVVAERIRSSDLCRVLVAALDDWAVCNAAVADERQRWLLDVARRADPDTTQWRERVRDPLAWRDASVLTALAASAPVAENSVPLLVALGERLQGVGGDAVPLLERAQREHPGDFWANLALGNALGRTAPAEAIRYYQTALGIRPRSAVVRNNLGGALAESGRMEEALDEFRRALALEPGFAAAHSNLGNALSSMGRATEALGEYELAVRYAPKSALTLSNLAIAFFNGRRSSEAIECFEAALALNPTYVNALSGYGLVLTRVGRVDEALRSLERALTIDPQDATARLNFASALCAAGRVDEAIALFERMLAARPDDAHAHSGMCRALRDRHRLEEAIRHGREAVRLAPESAEFHGNLGSALADAGRRDEAFEQFSKTVSLDPYDAAARTNLGNMLALRGDLDGAREQFERAIELDGRIALAHGALGQVHMLQGRLEDARVELERCIELLPEGSEVRLEAIRQLEKCESPGALEARLSAVLRGDETPTRGSDWLELARLCQVRGQHAQAARFAVRAFAAAPELADDLRTRERYNMACSAAIAGASRPANAAELDDAERATLRQQAREWLRADLAAWTRTLDRGDAARAALQEALAHWQVDPDLAGLRDPQAIAVLAAEERERCVELWTAVDALLARSR